MARSWQLTDEQAASLQIQCSLFRVIPKKSKPNKWRLIVNLSSLKGSSVNDGISKDLCSLSYMSVNSVAETVLRFGRGTELAQMDIKKTYRMIPVHQQDRVMLGMKWQGAEYVDKTLPFGLQFAPLQSLGGSGWSSVDDAAERGITG